MIIDAYMHRNAVHSEKALLLTPYTALQEFGKCHSDIARITLHEGYARWQRTNNVFCIEQMGLLAVVLKSKVYRDQPASLAALKMPSSKIILS